MNIVAHSLINILFHRALVSIMSTAMEHVPMEKSFPLGLDQFMPMESWIRDTERI